MGTHILDKSSQTRLPPGTLLRGSYQVEGVYGEGGFAVVYKALQINLRRHVAIKVLNPVPESLDGEAMVQRFLQEATAAANIRHPNVVMIHDVGFLDDRRPYIVMEPFDGHDMRRQLRHHGPLPPSRWLALVSDCLGALAKAHQAGIIHRDIKPDNLVLTDPGTQDESLKLIDFGIARLLNDQVNLTMESQRIGTMRYMAPEYIVSNIVSPAMDVFQMGLILVEGLTGQPVIRGQNDAQCIHMITHGIQAVPDALRASALGPVIAKSLEMDPALRYPDAGAMRAALSLVDAEALLGLDLTGGIPPGQPEDDSTTVDSLEILYTPDTSPHHHEPAPPTAAKTVASSPSHDVLALAPGPVVEDSVAAPDAAPRRQRKPWLLVGGIWVVVLCLLLVAVTLLWSSFTEQAPSSPQDPSSPSLSAATPPADIAPEGASPQQDERDGAAAPTEVPTSPVEASPQLLTIEVEPARATIHLGDELVGTGRAQLRAPSGAGASLTLRVEAEGFAPEMLSLSAPFEATTRVTLEPAVPPLAAEQPAAQVDRPAAAAPGAKVPSSQTRAAAESSPAPRAASKSAGEAPVKPAPKPAEEAPARKAPRPAKDLTFDIMD